MERITAIGEILYDIYPESKNLGGAPLNFLYHVHKLTGEGNIISRVGFDILGKKAVGFLRKSGISTEFVQTDHLHPTGVTTVSLDENKVPLFNIDIGRAFDFIEINDAVNQLVNEDTDCLYFGSLAQRSEKSRSTIHALLQKRIKYFCDLNIRQDYYTSEAVDRSLRASNVLKLNIDELELLNNLLIPEKSSVDYCARKVMEDYNIELMAVTKGAGGSALYFNGKKNDFEAASSNVVDTLGAGDAFAAIICLGYLKKWDMAKMNRLANEFAGQICGIKGALPESDDVYLKLKEKFNDE